MSEWFSTYKSTLVKTLIVALIFVLTFFLIYGIINDTFKNFFDEFFEIISPIIIGFVIAYLSNPIVMILEKYLFRWIKRFSTRRLISSLITLILLISFIVFIITMLIPSVISTLDSFWDTYIVNYESSLRSLAARINSIMDGFAFLDTTQRVDPDALVSWVRENMPWIDSVVSGDLSVILPNPSDADDSNQTITLSELFTSESIITIFGYAFSLGTSVINGIKNVFLGLFIAVYMLLSKEKCKAMGRRFLNSFLSPRSARSVIRFGKLLDRSFGGFIEGQLLDAIVVGIISYIVFNVFGIPIPHLLATIIAVTNVIPILGPFIGGVPAAILVLLTEPEKTILFILLIIVIQQIDGNIICPKIIGDKINISSLATIIAIVVMGGLFGIFGMLIGVPVFAVILNLIHNHTMNSLRRKGFETSLEHYYVGNTEGISYDKKNSKSLKKISESFVEKVHKITSSLLKKKKPNKKN